MSLETQENNRIPLTFNERELTNLLLSPGLHPIISSEILLHINGAQNVKDGLLTIHLTATELAPLMENEIIRKKVVELLFCKKEDLALTSILRRHGMSPSKTILDLTLDYLRRGQLISAIKEIRGDPTITATMGLKEAKEFCEDLRDNYINRQSITVPDNEEI